MKFLIIICLTLFELSGLTLSATVQETRDELLRRANNELDKIISIRKRDLREDVLKRADELLVLANNAVTALTQQRRPNAAELIQRVETDIQSVVTDLKNSTSVDVIERLENRLIELEYRLVEDLATVGRPVDVQEYIKLLITSAEALRTWAKLEIEALKQDNKNEDMAIIAAEDRIINAILAELQNKSTDQAVAVLRLEQRLNDAEFRLYEHLLRLSSPEAYRRQLIRMAEELAVRATIEIRLLAQQNRSIEAGALLNEVQQLVQLDVQLRDAVTDDELQQAERRLQAIEERIYTQLRALVAINQ